MLRTIIAIAAGDAASLALVTQSRLEESSWGQVIDAIIGVEIAASLLPPAAMIGIGLSLGHPEHSLHAFYLLLLNVVGLDLVGSIAILGIRGVRKRHLEAEKNIRQAAALVLHVVPGFISVGSTVNVILLDDQIAAVGIVCRRHFGGKVPELLAQEVAERVQQATGYLCDVTIEVIPVLVHSTRSHTGT